MPTFNGTKLVSKLKIDEGIVFFASIVVMFVTSYLYFGKGYVPSPDGNLYLSIADNFIKNGHFIQTDRPVTNHVATPGLAIILTILKLICDRVQFIIFVQYIVFGLTVLLFYKACMQFFNNKVVGVIAVVLYLSYMQGNGITISPSMILTEVYVMFILSYLFYVCSKIYIGEGNIEHLFLQMWFLVFAGYLIRSIVLMCYAPLGLYFLYLLWKRKIRPKCILYMIGIPALVLCLNLCVNYRETGEWIMMENYSGIPLYQANNANTKIYPYGSSKAEEFVDERFWEIYNDDTLGYSEKNALFKEETSEYIKNNTFLVIRTSLQKFEIMFLEYYPRCFEVMILSMLLLVIRKKKGRVFWATGVFTMLMICLPSSCGLNIFRYTMPAVPFYVFYKAALIGEIIEIIQERKEKRNVIV